MSGLELGVFVARMHQAKSFEEAAGWLLDAVLDRAAVTLDAAVQRGMVHLRPSGVYTGFLLRERAPRAAGMDPMPSMTAWHQVEALGRATLIDVRTRAVRGPSGAILPPVARGGGAGEFRSRDAVLEREATHIIAVPLRRPGGRVDGFVSLELAAKDEALAELWPALAPALELIVDVAAHFVGGLPRAPQPAVQGDEWLPVIGASMRALIADLRAFAGHDATLLLYGETGVGKTRLARWCYEQSLRAGKPFIHANLTAEREGLREGVLFGWTRGAFTGAEAPRVGVVTQADGGTLFIDEIDKLPPGEQAMLLSLLDDGQYRVMGDSTLRHADVRFIVGTNADLMREVEEGRFLRDLYYRICVLPVRIPPLRERRDEIVPWAEHMLQGQHRRRGDAGAVHLEAGAGALLVASPWHGNLRELHSVVQRAYVLACVEAVDKDVHVRASHVERALAGPARDRALATALQAAASAFVDSAMRRGGLRLELAGALEGYVLREALQRLDVKEALALLGHESYLKSGNQRKLIDRTEKLIKELEAALEGLAGQPA